ncbi:33202_t:CDS:2 [Racocetra persica]|uniref:33202_t:CDS:1 n=1 Tax=Racocetra persica TaxID=160502 RepID=A0ACA9KHZ6_9GLOM|nr:33202_t:CDS:2 [Racocetra persica]
MTTKEMQPMDIDDMQNTDTLGTNSNILKNVVRKLAEITQPFVLLINSVFIIVSEAVKVYENAKHNKNICASLLIRVNIAKTNVEILQLQPRICDHKAFNQFVEFLEIIVRGVTDMKSNINTIINEVQIINKKVDHLIHDPINNMINLKAVKINPKELDDLPNTETKNLLLKSYTERMMLLANLQTS